jgi:hypothetical protein
MLGIGLGVDWANKKESSIVTRLITAFQVRVAADGGVFEAQYCLNATLTYLDSIFSAAGTVKYFQDRVAEDGGVFEAKDCQITFINNLNNI